MGQKTYFATHRGESILNFDSFSDFLHMGGHGLYVWLCYGLAFFLFTIILLQPILTRKNIIRELSQIQRRNLNNETDDTSQIDLTETNSGANK